MAKKSLMHNVLDLSSDFVVKQGGMWDHEAWEAFLEKASALGLEINDESKRSLGNVLESCKYFLGASPACDGDGEVPAPKKRTPAKPKEKAKAKE